MHKKYWIWAGFITLAMTALFFILLKSDQRQSPEFQNYKKYSNELNTKWYISQETAESFADGNCDRIQRSGRAALKFENVDHLKSTASIIKAYCPNALNAFVAGTMIDHPEYKADALYILERLGNG